MENNALDTFIKEHLSPQISSPDRLIVFEARQTVIARGKNKAASHFFQSITQFLTSEVRMYHLGISTFLLFISFFYCQRINESSMHSGSFTPISEDAFALTNHTISVTSSTMLTSIPTLVIRN
jgi:hypothetical protein